MKTLANLNLRPVITGLAVASLLTLGACATSSRIGQITRLSPYDSPAAVPVAAPAPVAAAEPAPAPAYAPTPAPAYAPTPTYAPTPVAPAQPPVQRAMDPNAQAYAQGARDAQISAQVLRDQEAADRYEAQRDADLAAARAYSYYAVPYAYYPAPYYAPYYSPFNYGSSLWFSSGGRGYRGGRGGGHGRWGGSIGFGGW
ncbi:hypothetical protein BH09PSE6_BH09PSE6_23390 [soil metagenome]